MTGYHFSNSFPCNLLESRKRKPFFTGTETLYLVEQFEKHKDILTAKFCSTETNRRKNEIWAEITMGLHMRNPNVKRTVREVKKKWKNIVSMAKKEAIKAAEYSNESGSSPRLISEISQRVLDLFAYLPSLQNMLKVENGQEDIHEMRGYYGDGESGVNTVGSYGTNNDLFTLIRNDTRPTSPSEGSDLSTDGQEDRPSSFADAMPSTSTAVTTYRPEIEMVDLVKCETRSTSPSIISDDNSVNDCPLEDTRDKSENRLEVPLNLPLTADKETDNVVTTATTTSIRPSNNESPETINNLSVPVTLPMHTEKLEIDSINSISRSISPNVVEDIDLGPQESYTISKNDSKSLVTPAPVVATASPERRVEITEVSHTTAASVALTALCQSSLLTNNTSGCSLGNISNKSQKQCMEELTADEPSQKKLKSIPSDYLELHHTVLLLEKEKLQIEIEKMKREMVNQEKMTEILDIAKDVFVSLREKI